MPNYTFKDTNTDEIFEKFLKISDMERFVAENPHVIHWHETPATFSYNDARKPDGGFREVLQKIHSKHHGSKINTW